MENEMEANRDWKAPVALVFAGLALFIALSGRNEQGPQDAWQAARIERNIKGYVLDPIKPAQPKDPSVPMVPNSPVEPVVPDNPGVWDKFGWSQEPKIVIPDVPAVPEVQYAPKGGPGAYVWSLFAGPILSIYQLVQPVLLLLLVWLIVRQFTQPRGIRAGSSAPVGMTTAREEDITAPPEGGQAGGSR
jgi:hypothetical protein